MQFIDPLAKTANSKSNQGAKRPSYFFLKENARISELPLGTASPPTWYSVDLQNATWSSRGDAFRFIPKPGNASAVNDFSKPYDCSFTSPVVFLVFAFICLSSRPSWT
ncbi:hypothetical protein [Novipirellula rosea]|uniref:hypothetical protein n=1 Tax=Novipirellula rosea TaxID=1031540 RepID=UPI0031E8A5EE